MFGVVIYRELWSEVVQRVEGQLHYIVLCISRHQRLHQPSIGWISTTTGQIPQKVLNKLPEDGVLNAKTCRSGKRIILNDN
jgi:hypothetical protein